MTMRCGSPMQRLRRTQSLRVPGRVDDHPGFRYHPAARQLLKAGVCSPAPAVPLGEGVAGAFHVRRPSTIARAEVLTSAGFRISEIVYGLNRLISIITSREWPRFSVHLPV